VVAEARAASRPPGTRFIWDGVRRSGRGAGRSYAAAREPCSHAPDRIQVEDPPRHRTEADLNYEGSITIVSDLMDAADILPARAVQILNVNNGARFDTYALPRPAGIGRICLNGPRAPGARATRDHPHVRRDGARGMLRHVRRSCSWTRRTDRLSEAGGPQGRS